MIILRRTNESLMRAFSTWSSLNRASMPAQVKAAFTFDHKAMEILTGLLLGDAWLSKSGTNHRIAIEQKQQEYVQLLWDFFNELGIVGAKPAMRERKRITPEGSPITYTSWMFQTFGLPTLNTLHQSWYWSPVPGGKNLKRLPIDLEKYFTPLCLAQWIAGDGSYNKLQKCMYLHTNSFTRAEVSQLSDLLLRMYDIKTTVLVKNRDKDQWIIRIPASEVHKLVSLVRPHIPDTFLYRIGIDKL